jgi:hypothetical protein
MGNVTIIDVPKEVTSKDTITYQELLSILENMF